MRNGLHVLPDAAGDTLAGLLPLLARLDAPLDVTIRQGGRTVRLSVTDAAEAPAGPARVPHHPAGGLTPTDRELAGIAEDVPHKPGWFARRLNRECNSYLRSRLTFLTRLTPPLLARGVGGYRKPTPEGKP